MQKNNDEITLLKKHIQPTILFSWIFHNDVIWNRIWNMIWDQAIPYIWTRKCRLWERTFSTSSLRLCEINQVILCEWLHRGKNITLVWIETIFLFLKKYSYLIKIYLFIFCHYCVFRQLSSWSWHKFYVVGKQHYSTMIK